MSRLLHALPARANPAGTSTGRQQAACPIAVAQSRNRSGSSGRDGSTA